MLRAALGEVGLDAGGLWLDDSAQGWRLRAGDIRGELLREAAERGEAAIFRDMARSGPVWGLHFAKKF